MAGNPEEGLSKPYGEREAQIRRIGRDTQKRTPVFS